MLGHVPGAVHILCKAGQKEMKILHLYVALILLQGAGTFYLHQPNMGQGTMGDTTVSGPPASRNFDFFTKITQDHLYISPGTI